MTGKELLPLQHGQRPLPPTKKGRLFLQGPVRPAAGVDSDGFVSLGVVARAHGIRGGLRMHLWNADSDTIRQGMVIRLGARACQVTSCESGILYVQGVSDRNQAEALQGHEIKVLRRDFPSQELYLIDLIGASVVDEAGADLGVVAGTSENGPQVLLSVTFYNREVWVPYVSDIVREASATRVVLRPPLGLFRDEDAIVVGEDAMMPKRNKPPKKKPDAPKKHENKA